MSDIDRDERAFAALVREQLPAVRRYAARRVPPDHVDDVVAEVFAAAWRHRDRLPQPPTFWLLHTAWFHVRRQHRRQSRDGLLLGRLGALPATPAPDPGELVPDAIVVRDALARLAAADQEVLRLTAWEGLSVSEAAEVLGCAKATARVRLHRARRRLARQLSSNPSGPAAPGPAAESASPVAVPVPRRKADEDHA